MDNGRCKKAQYNGCQTPPNFVNHAHSCMKNLFLLFVITSLGLSSTAFGDIQSPSGHHFTWSRKLSRGIGNLMFGWLEYPTSWRKTNKSDGAIAAASDFLVEGTKRTLIRAGFGFYETITFPVPSWKRTYRPPYHHKEVLDNWWGYTEFAPEFGFRSEIPYSRSQGW
jgi:putative exosortase-associated protein (TIGR04073 family)